MGSGAARTLEGHPVGSLTEKWARAKSITLVQLLINYRKHTMQQQVAAATSISTSPTDPRLSVRRACASCRTRHSACDFQRPCRACKMERRICQEPLSAPSRSQQLTFINLDRSAAIANGSSTSTQCFFQFSSTGAPVVSSESRKRPWSCDDDARHLYAAEPKPVVSHRWSNGIRVRELLSDEQLWALTRCGSAADILLQLSFDKSPEHHTS